MALPPVYSAAFIEYDSNDPNTEFYVPEGADAVIRQVSAVQNAGGWALAVFIADIVGGDELQIIAGEGEGVPASLQQEGRWFVPAGGSMRVAFTQVGFGAAVYVGGYLFESTPASSAAVRQQRRSGDIEEIKPRLRNP